MSCWIEHENVVANRIKNKTVHKQCQWGLERQKELRELMGHKRREIDRDSKGVTVGGAGWKENNRFFIVAIKIIKSFIHSAWLNEIKVQHTSVNMIMPKTAKNAMTMRNDIEVRSREPHVALLLRFFKLPELLLFFEGSFEYIFPRRCLSLFADSPCHPHRHFRYSFESNWFFLCRWKRFVCLERSF